MCRFASFFHNPINGDIAISDLNSHSNTERELKLNLNVWREGHYLPNDEIECRVTDKDRVSQRKCEERLRKKYPKFSNFFNQYVGNKKYKGDLCLSGCDLKGIKLPESVGRSLYLSGCDLKGIKLPESVGGALDLSGCDLKGIKLPESVGGYLDLRGCDLKGIKLPESVGGYLDLRGCDLKGIDIPKRFENKIIK